MIYAGSMSGSQQMSVGRYYLGLSSNGDTLTHGQVVCWSGLAGNGLIDDPASVNDHTEAVGILKSQTLTQNTAQGSGGIIAEVTNDPFQIIRGRVSGTTAEGGAFLSNLNGNIMTEASGETAGLVLSDTDVGTSDFIGGYLVGLTGLNAGHTRIIDSHSDNTSETLVDPFDQNIEINNTFLRTFAPFLQGIELVAEFTEFMGGGVAGVNLPDTGHLCIMDVYVGGRQVSASPIASNRTRNQQVPIDSTTNPSVEAEACFIDHVFNSLA